MDEGIHKSFVYAVRKLMALQVVVISIAASGCEFGGGAPPPEGQLAIENVAKWYQLYRADHRGQSPPNEAAFVAFIKGKLQARGTTVDPDQLLTSPRDGQRYVVLYGARYSPNIDRNVAVYEKEGYDGKKLVAFESASCRELDDEELKTLLGGK